MTKLTFKEFLGETPLPDEWDKSIFSDRVPFAKRVRYAQQMAQKLGAGSSRVAFEIPYQGRRTVLKVAKNSKGIAQNEYEAEVLRDGYASRIGILVPLIDYDEANSSPHWIHVEYATKAKPSDFPKACGGSIQDLVQWVKERLGKKDGWRMGDPNKINDESDLAGGLLDLIGNFDMPTGDLARTANWGVFNGRLVIIDAGLSSDIYQVHYQRAA